MTMLIKTLAAVAAGTVLATSAFAQSAREVRGPSPYVAIENEPASKLIVDPPLPDQLARGHRPNPIPHPAAPCCRRREESNRCAHSLRSFCWPPSAPQTAQAPLGEVAQHVVRVDGLRFHYVTAGSGEPVVLIPGWPESWIAWRKVIPLVVKAGRQVYVLDPRGVWRQRQAGRGLRPRHRRPRPARLPGGDRARPPGRRRYRRPFHARRRKRSTIIGRDCPPVAKSSNAAGSRIDSASPGRYSLRPYRI